MLYHFALLSSCFINIFWAVTLLTKPGRNLRTQNVFMILSMVAAVLSFIWAVSITGFIRKEVFYRLEIVEEFALLASIPLFLLCFKSLTDERPFGWKDYIWFLPMVAIGGVHAALYVKIGGPHMPAIIHQMSTGGPEVRLTMPLEYRAMYFIGTTLLNIVIRIQLVLVVVYSVVRYLRYRRRIDEFFSNPEGKSINNSRAMVYSLYLFLVCAVTFSLGRYYYVEHEALAAGVMVFAAAVNYYMGYNVFKLKYTASDLALEEHQGDMEAEAEGYALTGETTDEVLYGGPREGRQRELFLAFEQLMQDREIFLQSDLRLDDVARMMHTNRTYISRMINECFGETFSDVVNRRRIAYAQEVMRSAPSMPLELVAESSGFTHVTYFSRMFRKLTGMTCRDWQEENSVSQSDL